MKKAISITGFIVGCLCFFSFSDDTSCPPEGRGKLKNGKYEELSAPEKRLNRMKNRNFKPHPGDIDNSVTIEKMLNSNDDSASFSFHKAASVKGYIFKGKNEGKETCNCNTDDKTQYDIHVYLSDKKITSKTKIADCVVIEVTPYAKLLHPEWTESYFNNVISGKSVTVTGWLLYDYKHTGESYETHPGGKNNKRHTVWEIHPITDIKVN